MSAEEKQGKPTTRAKNKYNAKNYDSLRIVVPKGRKDEIQAHAAAQGESLNGYVTKAVDERIERDKAISAFTVQPGEGWRRVKATYTTQAAKTLGRMDAATKQRIREGVNKIPAGDIVKLQGHTDLYRLRIGNWRVVYSYADADKILVEKIAPRGQVYKGV